MKKLTTMRKALADPAVLGDAMPGPSWAGWRIVLIAAAGETLSDDERETFKALTGREREPGEMIEVLLAICGRRSGKTKATATFAVYLATCCDWSDELSLGETGECIFLAPTEKQAERAHDYSRAIVDHVELLSELVESRTANTLTLKRSIVLETQAANWRTTRGGTSICIALDECAFFHSSDESANSDADILTALRPSLATTNGPVLLTSSPAGMQGIVYTLWKRHFGANGDKLCLVVQCDSKTLNPTLRQSVIDRAYEADAAGAGAEYGGEFREPISAYLDRSIVERAVEKGVQRRVPLPGVEYLAFLDSAGGSGKDSYTMAIGHWVRDDGRDICVIDCLFAQAPPFDPDETTAAAAATLKQWGLGEVYGDAYGGAWPVTAMARNGIRYMTSPLSASELYLHTLPLWTAGRVRMIDNDHAVDQLCSLRRRVGSGVAEKVVHPRNSHDDSANSIAGVLWRLSPVKRVVGEGYPEVVTAPRTGFPGSLNAEDEAYAALTRSGPGYGGGGAFIGGFRK